MIYPLQSTFCFKKKYLQVNEAGEDDNEDEATPEPEETPEERGERIR